MHSWYRWLRQVFNFSWSYLLNWWEPIKSFAKVPLSRMTFIFFHCLNINTLYLFKWRLMWDSRRCIDGSCTLWGKHSLRIKAFSNKIFGPLLFFFKEFSQFFEVFVLMCKLDLWVIFVDFLFDFLCTFNSFSMGSDPIVVKLPRHLKLISPKINNSNDLSSLFHEDADSFIFRNCNEAIWIFENRSNNGDSTEMSSNLLAENRVRYWNYFYILMLSCLQNSFVLKKWAYLFNVSIVRVIFYYWIYVRHFLRRNKRQITRPIFLNKNR